MHLNIAPKIFSIAVVVLALMAAVAILSINLTAKISDELDTVARKHVPVSDAVSEINVRILDQGVLLQRIFARGEKAGDGEQFKVLGGIVTGKMKEALIILDEESTALGAPLKFGNLEKHLRAIEEAYLQFEAHSWRLIEAQEQGKGNLFDELLPDLNRNQDIINRVIAKLRRQVEMLNEEAVLRADRNERILLNSNIILTILASILGIGLASLITRALVRNVRNLVTGTEAVEAGDLNTALPVMTKDEIGKLTGSFNTMVEGLRLKERIRNTFGKYMDPRIVTRLLDYPELSEPGGEKREMTVMFIDLKGFTSISEKLPPTDLVKLVNNFFTLMTEAVSDNMGVVDKFMGDAVMAYWGEPFTATGEHAGLACKAALDALDRLDTFRENVRNELGSMADDLEIDLRIGISTGDMIVGTIGSTASMNFTVMGDPVNLGSRLEGASKTYGTRILISEQTRDRAGVDFVTREIDLIRVKGKEKPTRVYELLSEQVDRDGVTLVLPAPALDSFQNGINAYRAQQWDQAEAAFKNCLTDFPGDPPSEIYLQRVSHLKENLPAQDWDGVWVFETK